MGVNDEYVSVGSTVGGWSWTGVVGSGFVKESQRLLQAWFGEADWDAKTKGEGDGEWHGIMDGPG